MGVGREPFWDDELLRDADGVQRPEGVAVVRQQHEGVCRLGVGGAENAHAAAPHFLQRQGELAQAEQVEQREEQPWRLRRQTEADRHRHTNSCDRCWISTVDGA